MIILLLALMIPDIEVLAFTADWCPACQRDKPYIKQLQQQGLKITIIDDPKENKSYRVKLLPTYIILNNGIEMKRTNNVHSLRKYTSVLKDMGKWEEIEERQLK